ncbi:hepcidin-like [Phyllopteryx taeniolatus]|uniref:hepcidin-like n=1 Tax=Phyllopteryx taeniolatus TaxID=161469 RepID=UPI0027A2F42E|nr:hepcidin-like [Phyllopteryx taeniolatus]UQM94869.1 antimicrobial peptide hepcidin type II [Phyllopteryx taeniolatus]
MKTFRFSVAVMIILALFYIQDGYTLSTDNGDPNQDMVKARDEEMIYEIPADHWKVASNNRQKRHTEPGACRFCCSHNCCGRGDFCGLCCQW